MRVAELLIELKKYDPNAYVTYYCTHYGVVEAEIVNMQGRRFGLGSMRTLIDDKICSVLVVLIDLVPILTVLQLAICLILVITCQMRYIPAMVLVITSLCVSIYLLVFAYKAIQQIFGLDE